MRSVRFLARALCAVPDIEVAPSWRWAYSEAKRRVIVNQAALELCDLRAAASSLAHELGHAAITRNHTAPEGRGGPWAVGRLWNALEDTRVDAWTSRCLPAMRPWLIGTTDPACDHATSLRWFPLSTQFVLAAAVLYRDPSGRTIEGCADVVERALARTAEVRVHYARMLDGLQPSQGCLVRADLPEAAVQDCSKRAYALMVHDVLPEFLALWEVDVDRISRMLRLHPDLTSRVARPDLFCSDSARQIVALSMEEGPSVADAAPASPEHREVAQRVLDHVFSTLDVYDGPRGAIREAERAINLGEVCKHIGMQRDRRATRREVHERGLQEVARDAYHQAWGAVRREVAVLASRLAGLSLRRDATGTRRRGLVGVIVDTSDVMSESRLRMAFEAAVLIAEVSQRLDWPVCVVGFWYGAHVFLEPGQRLDDRGRASLGRLWVNTVCASRYWKRRLIDQEDPGFSEVMGEVARCPADILVISAGPPVGGLSGDSLRGVVDRAERLPLQLATLGVGVGTDGLRRHFRRCAVDVPEQRVHGVAGAWLEGALLRFVGPARSSRHIVRSRGERRGR